MPNLTLSIPEDLKKQMAAFPEMNWSVIARESIKKRVEVLKAFREFTKDSELTEEDAIKLGKEVKKAAAKKYKKK
jgi:hypothetical protein